ERALRRRAVAGGELGRGHLVEIARPHEVVHAGGLLDRVLPPRPRHARRRDRRAAVRLVLAGGEHHERRVVQRGVGRGGGGPRRERVQVVVPALRVARGHGGEALRERGGGGVLRR